ncbi:hemolysin family protein [Paenibacillus kyungheensis]|uniref:Hemolysin family protein n=1 Tax=Paenibacillus kyungheensis TaxID=1452732 RepID=A0AAX3M028_9BACL|nr:hemolysin family protein [Paenibacillus kyungheensis]WCT55550.1 hemolysin family protein [Paenibacillus kyungheensis]
MKGESLLSDSINIGLNLTLFVILIIFTAFFVVVEFAIVKVRGSRIDQLIAEGNKNARYAKEVISNLDGYLSTCQLGITITALGLGMLGEPTVEYMLSPLFANVGVPASLSHILSYAIALILVTYFHVVVGELTPKTVALRKAELVTLYTARPIIWFNRIMYPFIFILNGSATFLTRLIGLQPASEHEEAHSEEELHIILNESYESGKINQSEYGYVSRIFAFDEMLAKELMVPRTDMVCLFTEKSPEENRMIIRKEQYTRFPVAEGSKDNIIGMINTKQFFLAAEETPDLNVAPLIHPVMSLSETTPVKHLLKRMQREGTHIAILVDEYGGTSGMITIEDILEEIVGEIRDEFDADEEDEIQQIAPNHLIVDGKVFINRVNDLLGTDLDDEELDTISGWLYGQRPDLAIGATYEFEDLTFKVLRRSARRYRKLEIVKKVVETDENEEIES